MKPPWEAMTEFYDEFHKSLLEKTVIKFARLNPKAIIPTKAKPGDAGFDLTAINYKYVNKGHSPYYEYEFGLAVEIPQGWVGLIFPRSSLSYKDLMMTNHVGVVDSGFRGPLTARFKTINSEPPIPPDLYSIGDRVAQLVVVPYFDGDVEEVNYGELSKTDRGSGGFGSTGN